MFRRTDNPDTTPAPAEKPEGKGRPTPSRKDAEAAARERARAGMDKKSAQKLLKDKRSVSNKTMREGMKNGEERFLPARDQGPVKRFIRDFVDSRLTFAEFVLPFLILVIIGGAVNNRTVNNISSGMQSASILLLLVDTLILRIKLRKELKTRFPEESLKGTTFYAFIRMLQLRFMRLPKPQVKIGGKPV